ncbi:MAG: hypothetical protein WDW38_011402 [Sanguina aurantia]
MLPPPPYPITGPVCGFKGDNSSDDLYTVSRFVTINNVRYAGSISISIVSVGELPFFEIDIPFYDGFTPIPEKTEWSSTYRQTCDQSANQLIYTAKFGLIGSLSYATVEPGAYLAFTSTRMTITTPIQASNLFNSWTDSYSGSSLCASERQGGVYFIMRVLNTCTEQPGYAPIPAGTTKAARAAIVLARVASRAAAVSVCVEETAAATTAAVAYAAAATTAATALKAATDTAVANAVNLAAHQLVASTGLTAAAAAVVAQAASDAVDDDPASPAKNSALAKANGVSDFANTAFADAQAALVLELVGYTAAMAQIQVNAARAAAKAISTATAAAAGLITAAGDAAALAVSVAAAAAALAIQVAAGP